VDSLQPPFSLIRREAAEREIPWCAEHETGVIVYSPMQSGLLTDGFTAARVAALAPDDWRRRSPQFQQPALDKNVALRDALKPIARRHGTTASAVAVAWTLAWPGVTGSGSARASSSMLATPPPIRAAACAVPMPRRVTRRAASCAARASSGLKLAR